MKLKVCGMRDEDNIRELLELDPDFMGMIFYEQSPRYVVNRPAIEKWPENVARVGVFVNSTEKEILEKVREYELDMVQLHGGESVNIVKDLFGKRIQVMKVFNVSDQLPVEKMQLYEPYVSYFLLDTKTSNYGGSGQKFDWSILEDYTLSKPFFLSGGIDLGDIPEIKKIKTDKFFAIDINSRFEIGAGLKDIKKIKELKAAL